MKVPFQQNMPYGCGFYALANLFNDDRYLNFVCEEGALVEHLNQAVRVLNPENYLSTIFCTCSEFEHFNRLLDKKLFFYDYKEPGSKEFAEQVSRPFFLCIKLKRLHHLILVIQHYKTNTFFIVDSLQDEIKQMPVEQMLLEYRIVEVMEVQAFDNNAKANEPQKTTFFFNEGLLHLLNA